LREIFKSVESNKDDIVNEEELATKPCAEEEVFKTLLVEVGLNTNFLVLKQLDGDSDKRLLRPMSRQPETRMRQLRSRSNG